MAEESAMKERNPQERRWKGPAAVIGTAALGLAALFGISRVVGTGEPKPVDNTANPSAAASPRPETPPPTALATEKPTPPPTEKPLTDQEKIELARKAQQEALAKGEFRLPVAQVVIDAGGRMDQGELLLGDERDLFVIVPEGKDVVFPALLDSKVIEARKLNPIIYIITIQVENKNLGILIPSTGTIHVKEGQSVSLGEPLFTIRYDPNSREQKVFEESGKLPKGTIVVLGLQDATAGPGKGFQELSIDKTLLKDSNGKFITIPTLKS